MARLPRSLTAAVAGLALWLLGAGLAGAQISNLGYAHVLTDAQLAASDKGTYPHGVWRDGYTVAGDATPLFFQPQTGACAANSQVNDGGACRDGVGGNSWRAFSIGPLDWRNFGGTIPFVLHVSATGSDGCAGGLAFCGGAGASYCTAAAPCFSAQHAVIQACKFGFQGFTGNTVQIDGTYSGPGFSLSGQCPGQGGGQISGQYLIVAGASGSGSVTLNAALATSASAAPTGSIAGTALTVSSGTGIAVGQTVVAPGVSGGTTIVSGSGTAWVVSKSQTVASRPMQSFVTQLFDVEPSAGALLQIQGINLAVAAGGAGTFAQLSGTVLQIGPDVKATGSSGAFAGIYAEGLATIEAAAGETITLQGAFACPMQADSSALVELDPGHGTISTGSGLTIPAGGGFLCPQGGFIEWAWDTLIGTATGDLIKATLGGRVAYFNSPPDPPGNGAVRLNVGAMIENADGSTVYPPHLGTCANGALQAGATNYDFNIAFSGVNVSCAVVFGKPSSASSYFSATPSCQATLTGATSAQTFSNFSSLGLTVSDAANYANGQIVSVHCAPPNGG